jgi:hypothetical protein
MNLVASSVAVVHEDTTADSPTQKLAQHQNSDRRIVLSIFFSLTPGFRSKDYDAVISNRGKRFNTITQPSKIAFPFLAYKDSSPHKNPKCDCSTPQHDHFGFETHSIEKIEMASCALDTGTILDGFCAAEIPLTCA